MTKPRTRFVINANSQVSELFGVVEGANGDLSIVPKYGELVEWGGGQAHGVTEYRTSVHVSPKSDGPTIVRHVRTTAGVYDRLYAKVIRTETRLLWPMMAMLSQDRFRRRYACTPKARDRVISLGTHCTLTSALVYIVILTDPGCNKPPGSDLLNHSVAEFSRFALHVFWGFIPMPSTARGRSVYPKTALFVEQDGHRVADEMTPALKSRTADQLRHWVVDALEDLIVHHTRFVMLTAAEDENPIPAAELSNLQRIFTDPPPAPPIQIVDGWGLSLTEPPD